MKKLISKAKDYLVEDGFFNTVYIIIHYLLRQIRTRLQRKSDYSEFKINAQEEPWIKKKKGPVIYIAAVVPYYDIGGGQRCSQLAKTFNKMGFRVKYLYTNSSSDKKDQKLLFPVDMHMKLDDSAITLLKNTLTKEDLIIFEAPISEFEPLINLAVEKGCRIAYENIDNWETSLGKEVLDKDVLEKLLKASDLITGTARPLVKQVEDYLNQFGIENRGQTLYLANAVDEEMFCGARKWEKPADMILGTKTFLYYGSLWGEWFDWDLIRGLAAQHPDYVIHLIGNAEQIPKIVKSCPKNVHFLGLKVQAELPAYLQYADYALLPFKRGEIGDYVSPLKIFEYISMYTRVLSTSLPDITGYPNVYYGDKLEEWEEVIRSNPPVDKKAVDEFIEKNTWYSRAAEMLSRVYGDEEQILLKDKLSIIILNYNNRNIIFKCINSLLRYREHYNYEIIVVDNGSKDGSYEMLQQEYKKNEILLLRNERNGCSSGRNLGVSRMKGEYIMFLDSDQWVTNRYWLKPYEDLLKQDKQAGCIGWAAGFLNASGGACYTVDKLSYRYMPPSGLGRTDVGYLGSGGMLMSRDLFDKIGGFDINYDPTCYEDTDITFKVRDYGKETYYCPYLGVIHLPHQTTQAGSEEHKQLIRSKKEYFISKWEQKNPELLKK